MTKWSDVYFHPGKYIVKSTQDSRARALIVVTRVAERVFKR